jgi:hypothetical protein
MQTDNRVRDDNQRIVAIGEIKSKTEHVKKKVKEDEFSNLLRQAFFQNST